ncbi:MAG TPA: potassium channel family protein [Terriglobales bacterium]|nr:potassium channel family protein [Terriglobales bacterium]
MQVLAGISGVVIVLLVLWEAFETIVLPRRVTRQFRFTRLYYRRTWSVWRTLVAGVRERRLRETLLSYFGPASLLGLIASWAVMLVLGFGLLNWSLETAARSNMPYRGIWTDIYFSGTTFFTLGLGDVTPRSAVGRLLTVLEGGTGFAFLALVIGYIPAIYQSFSRRETNITLLDARAGSPPSAGELLRRHALDGSLDALNPWLRDWEGWAADLLESHLSYPVLCYFRSQHDNQSWLGSLTAVLDTCALVLVGVDGVARRQARLTFAIARHAVVDLAQIFRARPMAPPRDRLPAERLQELRRFLGSAGLKLSDGVEAERQLTELRSIYEPYLFALAEAVEVALPDWMPAAEHADNWQTSAWGRIGAGGTPPGTSPKADHF